MTSPLNIKKVVLGPFATNCYIVSGRRCSHALIIDPAEPSNLLLETIRRENLTVVGIVNTHGHGDHIGGNGFLKSELGCPIMVSELDAPMLTDAHANLSAYLGVDCVESPPADCILRDGDTIRADSFSLKVIHTPGHSPGGICLYADGVLFSGDTLFAGSIGRTDFPGSSFDKLIESVRTRLIVLPDTTVVYPGHGPETTIGKERLTNPWLADS